MKSRVAFPNPCRALHTVSRTHTATLTLWRRDLRMFSKTDDHRWLRSIPSSPMPLQLSSSSSSRCGVHTPLWVVDTSSPSHASRIISIRLQPSFRGFPSWLFACRHFHFLWIHSCFCHCCGGLALSCWWWNCQGYWARVVDGTLWILWLRICT